jgi:hypothetical protein
MNDVSSGGKGKSRSPLYLPPHTASHDDRDERSVSPTPSHSNELNNP